MWAALTGTDKQTDTRALPSAVKTTGRRPVSLRATKSPPKPPIKIKISSRPLASRASLPLQFDSDGAGLAPPAPRRLPTNLRARGSFREAPPAPLPWVSATGFRCQVVPTVRDHRSCCIRPDQPYDGKRKGVEWTEARRRRRRRGSWRPTCSWAYHDGMEHTCWASLLR